MLGSAVLVVALEDTSGRCGTRAERSKWMWRLRKAAGRGSALGKGWHSAAKARLMVAVVGLSRAFRISSR